MNVALPPRPSLENLRKQAKTLQKRWRAGDADSLARLRTSHPQYAQLTDAQLRAIQPRLTDCQLVLAREAGVESWPQLKAIVEAANEELAQQFVDLACLCYDDPHYDHRSHHARARQMMVEHPELPETNIWAASAGGNVDAVAQFLRQNPSLVNQRGPHGWTPLFCACYSRVQPTFEAARLLVDHGANPNAYSLKQNDPPGSTHARRFTVLTGVFGGGSTGFANQPPHPQWRELAELLLERGANPNDAEALQINPAAALPLLVRFGLHGELLERELARSAREGHLDRVQLLMAHGARGDRFVQGKTAWERAMEGGNVAVAQYLAQAGAPTAALDEVEKFTAFCLAGDEAGARAMLEAAPDLLRRAPQSMVLKATSTKRIDAVRLALDLGFDPDFLDEVVALHNAAGEDTEAICRLLLERGASPRVREPFYDATPIGWADFFEQTRIRDLLLDEGDICIFDALEFGRLDCIPDILARDPEALERPFAKCLTREPRAEDWQTPLARMRQLGKEREVRWLLEHGAKASISGREYEE